MKKILSMMLAFALMLSLIVVPANAKSLGYSVTVSPSVTSVTESDTEQVVTFTISITPDNTKEIGAFSFELVPSTNLTLATKTTTQDSNFYYDDHAASLGYHPTYNTSGKFETYSYNETTKVLAAYGTKNGGITSETTVLTIMGKIAANATGSVSLNLKDVVVSDSSGTKYPSEPNPSATVTINAAPVALTGTASISGTAKCGQTLTASLTGGNNTGTLSYKWYRDNTVISGATGSTYTLVAADVGKAIKVEISSSVQTGSVTSSATSAVVKADAPAAPSCAFSFDGADAGKLVGSTTAMEYSLNGGSSWTACTANMALTVANIDATNDIKVRVKATDTANAGTVQTIDITKATTPSVGKTDCTTISNNNGALTGVTSAMEYKKSDATAWTTISGTTVTGLANGTYNVRVKATGTVLASDAANVTIAAYSATKETTPNATFTATGDSTGTLANVANGMKYSTNGGTNWTDITSTSINLTGLSAGTIKVVKKGNGTTTTDSDAQTIAVSKASTPNLTVTQPTTVGGTGSVATTSAHQFSTDGTTWADCTGTKTGLAAGTYYVRAKANGTTLASAAQTVTISAPVSVTGVSLNKNNTTIYVGSSETLTATVAPSNATNKNVTWNSSNTSIATVDQNGKVTGVAKGAATITVTTADGGKTAMCSVTVEAGGGGGGSGAASYAVSAASATHGKVTMDKTSASAGDIVTITVVPEKGFTLETLTVEDAKGNEVTLTTVKAGETYTFKMPAGKVTVSATFMEDNTMLNFFVDVKATDYYYNAVLWAAESGITLGVDATHFAPMAITTRGQMVTFLWRAAGCPEPTTATCAFTDIKANEYYYKAVLWAVENGITKGTSDTAFSPDANVSRAQTVTFLARMNGVKDDATGYSHSFADVNAANYYNNAVAWAATNDITNGTSATTFSPNDDCLRGQIVTFLYRNFVE